MRKILMIAGAVAMATSMPALAKDKGGHGGGHGGGKPEKQQSRGNGGGKAAKAEFRGGGNGNKSAERSAKQAEKRFDQRQRFAEKRSDSRAKQAEKRFERREKVAEKAEKRFEKQRELRFRDTDRRAERFVGREDRRDDRRDLRRIRGDDRFDDRRDRRDDRYRNFYADGYADCPPGLARKNNGCLPPGQAKKMFRPSRAFAAGQVLPLAYFGDYNIPDQYQSWYRDTPDYYYRYDDGGYIYQVDRGSNLVESLIPLLGGGFGVGQMLPGGYDTYNLPMAYRDDYIDSDEAYYRYGDDAIYQVDPQTNMIESIVALLAGDLNVGGLLPSGYDTYNLPMDYREQYVDSDDSMYRYADGNIYQVDPQSMIIEQIVASLV